MRTLKPLTLTDEEAAAVKTRIYTHVRFEEAPDIVESDGPCFIYTGAWQNERGHKKIRWRREVFYVHRLMYVAEHGDIPEGLILDHKCRCPACCNPKHLEPVTVKVNTERGNGKWIFEQGYMPRGMTE